MEGKHAKDYDYVDFFKDTVFITITLNYIQDPYINRSSAASV
jgi:hypothetical protein